MISTFLPAQALRTSRKTGGLNSRPSCVRDGVCVLALSRFVSRFGRARAHDRFAVFSPTLRDGRRRLVPQPSRDGAARAVGRLLYVGTLLPAWTFTSGIESPGFTMAAAGRERFAAGGSVLLLLYGPRACHTQRAMAAI